MKAQFADTIEKVLPNVITWRRHMHQYPEPSFKEFETTEYLVKEVGKLGNVIISRPTKTGLVVRLKGSKPGPVIALRADIDALEMPELTGLDFASQRDGVMHACGHDSHAAMLLGALTVMSEHQAELRGEYVFLFQPAEETPPGGALGFVNAGVMDGVDAVLGQHIATDKPVGYIGVQAGPIMANYDIFDIVIKGKGGHASAPHLSIDPIPPTVQLVSSLQQIVSRQMNPTESAVVSVTSIIGGTAHNIIPDMVAIKGTVRTYSQENREAIAHRIQKMAESISTASDCVAEVQYSFGYPAVINTQEYVDAIWEVADGIFGEGTALPMKPNMGGEDFAYYLQKAPGCFYNLGIQNAEKGCIYGVHNTKFALDEDAFGMGVTLLVNGALKFSELVEQKKGAPV